VGYIKEKGARSFVGIKERNKQLSALQKIAKWCLYFLWIFTENIRHHFTIVCEDSEK